MIVVAEFLVGTDVKSNARLHVMTMRAVSLRSGIDQLLEYIRSDCSLTYQCISIFGQRFSLASRRCILGFVLY